MKIKVTQKVLDYAGKPISDQDDGEDVNLRQIIITALNNIAQNETLTTETKSKIYALSNKLWSGSEVNLTFDERALIKERAGKILTPLTFGRVCEMLFVDEKDPEEKDQNEKPA